jgi:hypothetical protein
MSFVEIFTLCDGDPLVELIEFGVVKVLSFRDAVGDYSASCGWLSGKEREDIIFPGD